MLIENILKVDLYKLLKKVHESWITQEKAFSFSQTSAPNIFDEWASAQIYLRNTFNINTIGHV